ncbi:MAG: tail fiber domain-containing protein [Thermodesulfovibrionales bacterium]
MKKLLVVVMAVAALASLLVTPGFGADKLKVMDSGGTNPAFTVTDGGLVGVGNVAPTEPMDIQGDGISTNIRLTRYGANPGAVFRAAGGSAASPSQVLANGLLGGFVAAGYTSAGAFSANKIGVYFRAAENFTASAQGTYFTFETTHVGSITKAVKMTLNDTGLNVVGTISQTSSRAAKDNINELSAEKAMDAIKTITPVTYNYKNNDESHVGFIAEDVPELVASKDRKSLSPMDIVAVLTKVVQEQNKTIEALSAKIDMIEKASKNHKDL